MHGAGIRVRTEGKVLIAAIPRTAVIAAFWEGLREANQKG